MLRVLGEAGESAGAVVCVALSVITTIDLRWSMLFRNELGDLTSALNALDRQLLRRLAPRALKS